LKRNKESKQTDANSEIWQSIEIDDYEREHLVQLKELVTCSNVTKIGNNNSEHSLSVETMSSEKMRPNMATDIGGNNINICSIGLVITSYI